jgi:hypothetical protein
VIGLACGATAATLVQRQRLATLEAQAASAAEQARLAAQLKAKLEESDRVNESLVERLNAARSSATSTPAETETQGNTVPSAKPTRQFAFIESLKAGDPGSLVADYAQYLVGAAAAKAAAAAGEESPPPNDYYVVNDNPKLRTLAVSPSAKVVLVSRPGEGSDAAGYPSDVETLAKWLADKGWESASLRSNGYWLTIENGLVTGIEEQYAP